MAGLTTQQYPFEVEVRDGLGRPARLRYGLEADRAVFVLQLIDSDHALAAFSVSRAECPEFVTAAQTVCQGLNMRAQS